MESPRDECDIAAVGMARATLSEIAALRKNPGAARAQPADFHFLKHADEQTVVAVAALLDAVKHFRNDVSFERWGVVAAPRWPGRIGTANALAKYQTDGARSVSALIIPNLCLHAMSGTLSLAFSMHGPNFGVGGGLANVADGLLAGLVVQLEHRLPGTWVVLAEWEVEPSVPAAPDSSAMAVALALVCRGTQPSGLRLCLQPAASLPMQPAYPRLAGLARYLRGASLAEPTWSCALDWGMELVLSREESGHECEPGSLDHGTGDGQPLGQQLYAGR